ncbi:unnamed protein product [Adineta steineri]|uniref:Uncharacterized protein n=1 Tax=Adineta steineri TaxID=433720 RepID=A0A819U150_9BILA|nr:unnamed protein product [Adineta steineri]CAF4087128.1 unnamed protein product [Adineta steineri]
MNARDAEKEALTLLSNSNESTYAKITSLLAGQHLSLFKKLVNRTVIITPVVYVWKTKEEEAASNECELMLPSHLELLYDCESKTGQLIVEWNETQKQRQRKRL